MPFVDLPRDLEPVINKFLKEQKLFVGSAEGKATIRRVTNFGNSLRQITDSDFLNEKGIASATGTIGWITRLPEKIVSNPKAAFIDLNQMSKREAAITISAGLQVIALGINALLIGTEKPNDFVPKAILHAAFGADPAAIAIRKPMVDPRFPWLLPWGDIKVPNIDKLILAGTLLELLETISTCGYASHMERNWINQIKPIGRVTGINTQGRSCAGEKITIEYAGFGVSPPPLNNVSDIIISLPTSNGGCKHLSILSIAGDFFDHSKWTDSGTITLTLPSDILTGCIGFFTLPAFISGMGPCGPGDLVNAAGMFQNVLHKQFGPWGMMIGQGIFDMAEMIEGNTVNQLPCAKCQVDNVNRLNAGPPIIHEFRVQQIGPIHPRGFVTLQWSVDNATHVEIVPRSVTWSENAHELPLIATPLASNGSMQVVIPCTRRWEGEYVLRASNANGCSAGPLEDSITLLSGYSTYLIGVAKADIVDRRPMLGMAGFAYTNQLSSGNVNRTAPLPQYARAFVIEENKAANPARIAIVVADIWICPEAIKTAVVERLNTNYGAPRFSPETVLIAATHTHAGPGGYSEYFLYNLTIGGFDHHVFDTIVNGIVYAIESAYLNCKPGRIFVNTGDLANCGSNRSFEAFQRNPEFSWGKPDEWTDREMLLLKFDQDVDNRGRTKPIGALNWFAIHPTSLGMYNTDVSGDNKGWAEKEFEEEIAGRWGLRRNPEFVAAFANSNAGDVSGNVTLDGFGNKTVVMPLGGPTDIPALYRDTRRMIEIGTLQFDHALKLFDSATQEVTGQIAVSYIDVDMSNVGIFGKPGARTWPAALGVSFGAGSSEDSIALATIGGIDIPSGIIEGMAQADMTAAAVAAWVDIALLAPQAPQTAAAIILAITTKTPVVGALLPAVLTALPLFLIPGARSYVSSMIAAAAFEGQLTSWEDEQGYWNWSISNITADYKLGHGEKPIMFPVGLTELIFTPKPGSNAVAFTKPCPIVPHVVPFQLIRIGSIAIAGVPSELTTMAGKHLKKSLNVAFGGMLSHVAISGYTNAYSGYVTTHEEYDAQHYEGASTLYGPYTLEAYLQTFDKLAAAMLGGYWYWTTPWKVPGIFPKP